MPIINNVGLSEATPVKHDQIKNFLGMHISIVASIFQKRDITSPYYYFDLNAGPGEYEGMIGSPILFIQAAEAAKIRYKAVMYELDRGNYEQLTEKIGDNWNVQTINASNEEIANFPQLGSKPFNKIEYGLLFADPNGGHPNWESIGKFFKHKNHRAIDVMLYLSATGIKRISRSIDSMPRLKEGMDIIGKSYWLVREPIDAHQWTFLVGSNWVDLPEWQRRGFYRIDSTKGSAILDRLHYTASEYKHEKEPRQLNLAYV